MQVPTRIGGGAAIGGALVVMAGTLLHPLDANPGDPIAAFNEYAADDLWVVSHLGQFLGVALMFVGLVALSGVLKKERSGWLTDVGVFFGVAALATTAALQAVDGIALKVMVDSWAHAAAPEKVNMFHATFGVRQIEVGLASYMAILFGTTVMLFGLALVLCDIFPIWLGWIGICGGVGTTIGGLMTAFNGFSITAMNLAMPFNLVVVIWIVLVGVFLWRQH